MSDTQHVTADRSAPDLDVVIFGASGDLASRKVLPAVGAVASRARLHVVGAGRSDLSNERFRQAVGETTGRTDLAADADWVRLDYGDPATYGGLLQALRRDAAVYYLATPPSTFAPILSALASSGLTHRGDASRIVVEKPLGEDEATAHQLNGQLAALFDESQVYRIDHYLAKDTVQNVLAFRFSNALFESAWNRLLIDSIQITAAEDLDVGHRAGYYDHFGAVRDMIQNHVLQILALMTMEPPTTFDAADIRDAKTRLLRSVRPLDPSAAVRGQYEGYQEAEGVAPGSRRETFAAARLNIHNWRWQGVPIFVRTGKALRGAVTEAVIKFREAPHLHLAGRPVPPIPTLLMIRFQPHEEVQLRIGAKVPGAHFELVPAGLSLEYRRLARGPLPDAYENVFAEVLEGGHSVFPGPDEIERAWHIVDPLLRAWEAEGSPVKYARGSWGPAEADALIAEHGGGAWIASAEEPGISGV
ncbi:MAG: glucose-6-phosphate dehydrogenase [Chloroflexi bacterium]|nr:MAG: glucose-6-phosphate dehydrogenase [Chloroflexota bacterium]